MTDDILRWQPQIDMVIRKYAQRCPRQDRDDLRQEAYLVLFEEAEKIRQAEARSPDEARKLVYGIVRRQIRNLLRKNSHLNSECSLQDLDEADSLAAAVPSVEPPVHVGDLGVALERALGRIPEAEAYVVCQLVNNGVKEQDLAAELGRSRHWVRATKRIALQKLKDLM